MQFKIGFEIHQRLDTHKLFCECPSPDTSEMGTAGEEVVITRRLRPVASETGQLDKAAMAEYLSGKFYEYHAPSRFSCLVELDEEPPHSVNSDALKIAIQIAKIFNSKPVEEVHPMRKIVIDGSNTSGFQRTMLIARDGWFEISGKKITIPTIYLEEESAFIVEKKKNKTIYRLDRLGIPLVELSTGVIENVTPDEAKGIALRIGKLLRATGKVKRGLGTIRQDINISIPGGARVEIKGAQELDLIPEIIRREVQRQKTLLDVRSKIKEKNLPRVKFSPVDVTSIFKDSRCGFLRKAKYILGQAVPGFSGILGIEVQPGRRVGTEISDYAKKAGVGGIIHSDEDLKKYPISDKEISKIREMLSIKEGDAFIIIAGDKEKAENGLELAVERINMLFDGVPEEVRKVLPDGNTSYMRPMPGAARMYPETDVPPFVLEKGLWESIKIPEFPEETEARLVKSGLSDDLAKVLVNSGEFSLFDKIMKSTKADPKLVASVLVNTRKALARGGVPVDRLSDDDWIAIFNSGIPKEAIPDAIAEFSKSLDPSVLEKFKGMSEEEARKRIHGIISNIPNLSQKKNPFAVAMGEVMRVLRGKVDGKLIAKIVNQELSNRD